MDYDTRAHSSLPGDVAVDEGLRAFLSGVYLKLAGGLALSAGVAWCVAYVPVLRDIFFISMPGEIVGFSGWGWVLLFSPLVVLLAASFTARDQTARGSGLLYWAIAVLIGGSLSLLVLGYTGASLVSTFLITAIAFASLSFWGYVSKRNLTGLGNFALSALVGLILAWLVNLFLGSLTLNLVLDAVGVLIFSALIAADTQRMKLIYYNVEDPSALQAASNYSALTLYLNFINLFELLLSLSGGRSRR